MNNSKWFELEIKSYYLLSSLHIVYHTDQYQSLIYEKGKGIKISNRIYDLKLRQWDFVNSLMNPQAGKRIKQTIAMNLSQKFGLNKAYIFQTTHRLTLIYM